MNTFTISSQESSGSFDLSDNILFKNASDFSHFIETAALENNETCVNTILEYCDERDIDPDAIAKFVSASLKGKLQQELIESGLLPNSNDLTGF